MVLFDRGLAVEEERGLRVVFRELFRLAAQLIAFDRLGKRYKAQFSGLKWTPSAQRVRLVGDTASWDRLAMEPVALIVVHLRYGSVDRDLVKIRTTKSGQLRVVVRK